MTILCYHSVDPDWDSPLAVTPDELQQQCAWLARRRRVLPLREAVDLLDHRGRLPRGVTTLTFDDGLAELEQHALPVLTRHRLPATVFLVAQTLSPGGQPVDWVDTPREPPLRTLTLDQVRAMQAAGVEFESHSWAHLDLTSLGFEACVRDLTDSRELLSDLLGRRVSMLAYPRGRHDAVVRAAAERAGYSHAFALPEQPEAPSRHAIPRVGVYRGNRLAVVRLKSSRPYLRLRTGRAHALGRRVLGR